MLMVTVTYCCIVGASTLVYLKRAAPDKLEGFAMGLVIGFASFAVKTLSEYFGREDRVKKPNEEAGK
jgi:hypothetical protein